MSIYLEHFGLREEPFSLAPDPRFLYGSEQHREALAHLLYGVRDGGGFVLLTGEVGTGKTTVFRCFLEEMPREIRLALVLHPRLSARELLAAVCTDFGLDISGKESTGALVAVLNGFLLQEAERGGRAVIVIDEAQNLSRQVLEELRLLTNLETNRRKLLQIILIGQPELRETLARPDLRQVNQRVVARYHLGPLARGETGPYIRHRLSAAGTGEDLLPPSTWPLIHRLSRGVPRLVNLVCDRALLGAYASGEKRAGPGLVRGAAREVLGGTARRWQSAAAAAALLAAVALLTGTFPGRDREVPAGPAEEAVAAVEAKISRESPADDDTHLREEPEKGLEWLLAEAARGTRSDGERILLALWTGTSAAVATGLCADASSIGLRCLEGTGGIADIERLDRPALLAIPSDSGKKVFAVLSAGGTDSSRLLFRGGEGEVRLRWYGAYTVLWRPPRGWSEAVLPGRRSAIVPWIRTALGEAGYGTGEESGRGYDPETVALVREFQRDRGLKEDGIVGPLTLIYLNTAVGTEGPRLDGGGE